MTEPATAGKSLSEVLEGHLPLTSNRDVFDRLVEARKRPCIAIVLAPGGQLRRSVFPALMSVVGSVPRQTPVDLFVDQLGRVTEEAWRLVAVLHERFGGYRAIIPFAASPAVSQIALGADALVMGEAASLAPTLISNTREQGDIRKALVEIIARRCLATHIDADGNAKHIDHVVERMCGGFISEHFPVMRRDVRDDLGLEVEIPDDGLADIIGELHAHYRHMHEIEGDLVWNDRHFSVNFDGFIDTPSERRVLVRVDRLDERGHAVSDTPVIRRWFRPGGTDVVMNESVEL